MDMQHGNMDIQQGHEARICSISKQKDAKWTYMMDKQHEQTCSMDVKLAHATKGGQTAAQRTTEMLADQRTGKNSGPAPADHRN
jgi:hypothetical protein